MALLALLRLTMASSAMATSLYDISAVDIDGNTVSLDFKGSVTLIMNVACK